MSALEEEDHYPVFVPLSLLPQQDDHSLGTHKTHESHTERHRNTVDYVAVHNSPATNRKNAGILLRRVGDDFNARKFPDLVELAKNRHRALSESDVIHEASRRPARPMSLIRRLSQSAIGPSTPTPRVSKQPLLPEIKSEEEH